MCNFNIDTGRFLYDKEGLGNTLPAEVCRYAELGSDIFPRESCVLFPIASELANLTYILKGHGCN